MSNYDRIGILYDKVEKLVGVRYAVYDAEANGQDWIEAIEMQFETGVATVYVESEFDTLRIELGEMRVASNCFIKDAASLTPWNIAIGRTMAWIWLLTNQQGYEDGLRFEFSSKDDDKISIIITLIGIASHIQIWLSQQIDLNKKSA